MEIEEPNVKYEKFRDTVLKLSKPRVHKVRGSLGVYDAYKYIRKNKWFDIGQSLTEHEFYTIIRQVNNYLIDNLLNGGDIVLPHRLGTIELRKRDTYVSISNGGLRTNLPVDWNQTLKLWSEDRESFTNRTLVRLEEKEVFKVFFNKKSATFNNKSFYTFEVNKDVKRRLKKQIKNSTIDAFKLYE